MRTCWSFGPDRVRRVCVPGPGMTAQMRDNGVFRTHDSWLAEFHVERAKREDPTFTRSLEKAAAEYVRELDAPREPMTWEGDDA